MEFSLHPGSANPGLYPGAGRFVGKKKRAPAGAR